MTANILTRVFSEAQRNERHQTNAETRYWCDQYKQIAAEAIKALANPEWTGLTHDQKQNLNEALNLNGRFAVIDAIEAVVKGNNT